MRKQTDKQKRKRKRKEILIKQFTGTVVFLCHLTGLIYYTLNLIH